MTRSITPRSLETRQTKQKLRNQFLKKRQKIPQTERQQASAVIANKLIDIVDWGRVGSLHVYDAADSLAEIKVSNFLHDLSLKWPKITIEQPALDANAPMPDKVFDVVILPALCFDDSGFRLGLGSGWYDRFLSMQKHAIKIGLAYSWSKVTQLPVESHDVKLNIIVTEKENHFFENRV